MAGFPGETAADFEDALALCHEVGFARLHCFPYSVRSKTAAARMAGQVSPDARKDRMARLLALSDELSLAFRRRFAGTVRPVLWENEQDVAGERRWFGHTDNYLGVYMAGKGLRRRVTPVLIGAVYHDGLEGGCPQEMA
jgi:threonylcarbamoyladenosine tRNA methylthiotransferase MtaB